MTASRAEGHALAEDLAKQHRRFLSYLKKHVGSRDDAEDILQSAYEKVMRSRRKPSSEDAVAWFFRVLRNAMIDHVRKGATDSSTGARFAREVEAFVQGPEFEKLVCRCVNTTLQSIPTSLAEAVRSVDVEGSSVEDYASRAGLSRTNAYVRLHRGRKSLKSSLIKTCGACSSHGCLDCTCGQ